MTNRKIKGAFLLALFCLLISCGADVSEKKGDKYYALGEYYDAAAQYKKAYSRTPPKERAERGKRALKLAECYQRINSHQRAIGAYRNAIRYKQTDSLTLLNLGEMLLKNGSYKEAGQTFQAFLDSLPEDDGARYLARQGLKSAKAGQVAKQQKQEYTVKRMEVFNSRRADFSPMLFGDQGDYLYFTSSRNEAQGDELSGITGMKNGDIFFSQKDEKGKWGKPQTIETGLNTEYDEGACCFSPDGHTMYLTQCLTDPSYPRYAQICTSQRSDAAWGAPQKLEITRDTLSSFAHPAVSPDGQWLYFVSDMPGGEGGLDIWKVRITGNGGLGGVENLGPEINTPGDEMFPTFRPNGDLYFSSNGRGGLGGLDIYIARSNHTDEQEIIVDEREQFKSGAKDSTKAKTTAKKSAKKRNANNKKLGGDVVTGEDWTVIHPGLPLNSAGDDFGMTFDGLHNRGYFSSNRGDARGWDHIYWFENPEIIQTIKGWVYETDGYELPAAQVRMVGSDGTNLRLSVRSDGSFTQEVEPGVEYVLLASCRGYLNHREEIKIEPSEKSEEHVLQFPLPSINVPVLIDNIFYDFDKATLRPESATALDSLANMLKENPNITIELRAHCDSVGKADYNQRLSQRRAETVVRYLINKGIAADRLTPKGYGESLPKTVRKRLSEQYPWLKEGQVLTPQYIQTLNKEQQEICNQLNRRTEFLVLRTTYNMFDEKGNLKNPPKKKEEPEEEEYDDGLGFDEFDF